MAAAPFALPLLAFQHHVGQLYIDPAEIDFVAELSSSSDLAIVERGRWQRRDGLTCSVVVKVWRPYVVATPQDFRELLLEASKLHRLRHPHIARFLGLGCFSHGSLAEVRESMFMVEEYVGSRTLRKLIGEQMRCRLKNIYSMTTALRWAAEIAAALVTLHEQQPAYVHADLKADNVFLTDAADLRQAAAKIGDLKPHRHVYDREPSMLTQHQQQQLARPGRQSSLARYTLERSSGGSSSSRCSWSSTPPSSVVSTHLGGPWPAVGCRQQLEQLAAQQEQLAAGPLLSVRPQGPLLAAPDCLADTAQHAAWLTAACKPAHGGSCSQPVPIAACSGRAGRGGSAPAHCEPGMPVDSAGSPSYLASGASHAGASSFSRLSPAGSPGGELPDALCMPSSAPPAACSLAAEARAADAAALHAQQQGQAQAGATAVGFRRRSGRALFLSDSASSTSGSSSSSALGKQVRGGPISLAAAGDADDDLLDAGAAAAEDDEDAPLQLARPLQQQRSLPAAARITSCSSDGAAPACAAPGEPHCRRASSAPHCQQLAPGSPPAGEQPAAQLVHANSAPEPSCQRECKVHDGCLMPRGERRAHGDSAAAVLQRHLSAGAALAAEKQQLAPGRSELRRAQLAAAGCDAGGSVFYGWELSPSGAASPCGAVHSAMLDLFADLADDEVIVTRRCRDSAQYTLVPGSFVAHKVALPSSLAPAASAPPSFSKAGSASWDVPPIAASASCSLGSIGAPPPAGGLAPGSPQLATAAPAPLERAGSLGKGGAPVGDESKQHGSNSAFAALTAIDCIREETSSIATDSCPCSAATSRESTAHGGTQFFGDANSSPASARDQQQQQQPQVGGPTPHRQSSLSSLLGSGSLPRALSIGALLPQRSSLGSGRGGDGSAGCGSSDGATLKTPHSGSRGSPPGSPPDSPPASPCRPLGFGHCSSSGSGASSRWADQLALPDALAKAPEPGPKAKGGGDAACCAGSEPCGRVLVAAIADPPSSASCGREGRGTGASSPGGRGGGGAAAGTVKRVRFTLERPAGSTPSRDYGLLYAAPELVKGHRPTEKVDVFAFGCVLYELLSRSLLVSQCAAAAAASRGSNVSRRGRARRGSRARHAGAPEPPAFALGGGGDDGDDASSARSGGDAGDGSLPEQQLLLAYAQAVAGGYRPPFPDHFPEPVRRVISSCWAPEPHERPRMADVLVQLQELAADRQLVSGLDSYLAGLADLGYGGARGRQPSCGCVIS